MTEILKQCATCKEWLPATSDYFHKRGDRRKTPWKGSCKKCLNKLPVVKVSDLAAREGYKICRQCRKEKPATDEYFDKRKRSADGLASHCKECVSGQRQKYRQGNQDEIKQKKKAYYTQNKEDILQDRKRRYWADPDRHRLLNRQQYAIYRDERLLYSLRYRTENRSRLRASQRAYYLRNRLKKNEYNRKYREQYHDQLLDHNRRWRRNNQEKTRVINRNRSARKRSLPDTLTADRWRSALDYFGGCCVYCGRPAGLFHTMAIEHFVPLSDPDCPGTTALNCLPACHGQLGCNNQKHTKPAATWLEAKFGKRKAAEILARINAYFEWVKTQPE